MKNNVWLAVIFIVGIILGISAAMIYQNQLKPSQKTELSFKDVAVGKVVPSEIAYQMKQEGQDIILIDVREKEEWDAEHIPGAVWIPHSKLKENDTEAWGQLETLAKTHQNIFAYCGAGHRSGFIAELAQKR